MMQAQFSVSTRPATAVLHCRGELDLACRAELCAGLGDLALSHAPRMVVDLAGVTFMDCGSVSSLEALARGSSPSRSTYVVEPRGVVRLLFSVIDIDAALHVAPNLADVIGDPAVDRQAAG